MNQEPDYMSDRDGDPDRERGLERSMPHNEESERAILGGIILDNEQLPIAMADLRGPDDFYIPSNRMVYTAMLLLFEQGLPINPILIGNEIKSAEGSVEKAGGISYITNLTYGLPHSSNISHYCKVVKGKSTLRQLIKASAKSIEEAYEEKDEPKIIVDNASAAVFNIAIENTDRTFERMGVLSHARLQQAWETSQSGNALTGLDTGFVDLNAMTLGWKRGNLVILAGRPSMGKTALGLMFAQNAALRAGANVAFFSLEMTKEEVAMRTLCSEARVGTKSFEGGFISEPEWGRLDDVHNTLTASRLWVDDSPAISVLQMKAKARRLVAQHGSLDLIIIDYLQLMVGSGKKKNESKQQEITQIADDLKAAAKDLNVPLVALSQLNRAPENRSDHRPMMADLRESGAIEQNADLVGLIFRGDYYKGPNEEHDHLAELNIAKHRNGPTGLVSLRFDAPSTRFDNLYNEEPSHQQALS